MLVNLIVTVANMTAEDLYTEYDEASFSPLSV